LCVSRLPVGHQLTAVVEEKERRDCVMAAKEETGGMAVVRCAGRLGMVASVAANIVALAWFIRQRYFSGGNGGSGDDDANEINTVQGSKGKPPVTPDSVVNLDQ
jgi:L-tryptophan--pyruvate aminotransferase